MIRKAAGSIPVGAAIYYLTKIEMLFMPYTIYDSRITAAENPHTFYQPCEERRNAVTAGDLVKVVFQFESENDDGGMVMPERMWVEITGTAQQDGEEMLVGKLQSQPCNDIIECDEVVTFIRGAIIEIETERTDDPVETNVQDEGIFKRCLVDERVWEDGIPVARVTYGHAKPDDFDHPLGWGGLMVLGEGWEEGMSLTIGTPAGILRSNPTAAGVLLGNNDNASVAEKVGDSWVRKTA